MSAGSKTDATERVPPSVEPLLADWWSLRRDRQVEMDASIARRADTEILYDQPYEDAKRLRVTGPFTVESLSPHRTISVKRKKDLADGTAIPGVSVKLIGTGDFGNIMIENLKKVGIQNTIKNERLKFDRLDVHPGVWIHAVGEYTDKEGKSRRVAVTLGPEHGTVGPELVKEAAKEAVQGIGYDVLVVAGFAFDPHVSEEAKRYGKLAVLPTRINADLQLGDEFLKKTGAGNLFTVFGEPDVVVNSGEWIVDSRGKRVMGYECCKKLSGLDRLAEINGLGEGDLRCFAQLSQRRDLWACLADAAGRGECAGEYRGGSRTAKPWRVSAVPGDRQGIAVGIGDFARFVADTGLSDNLRLRQAVEALRRDRKIADELAQGPVGPEGLTTIHYPLATRHLAQVTIRGLDIYDPTTGEIRNSSPDDIACWFIDTDYNGESFFVRHAYFTGADQPYDKLKRALRAEVDEAAWSALYSARSRPFDMPKTGKIAVKVINHYGDEVLKVYTCP